jgi:hypothetical protein
MSVRPGTSSRPVTRSPTARTSTQGELPNDPQVYIRPAEDDKHRALRHLTVDH